MYIRHIYWVTFVDGFERKEERGVGSDSTADSGSLPALVRPTKLTVGAGKQYVRANAEMQNLNLQIFFAASK